MPSASDLAWLIPVLPLLGACLTGLGLISFNRTVNRLRKPVALFLISCVGAAAVLSYAVLAEQMAGAGPTEMLFNWASAGSFNLPMGFRVDPLGAVMLALVTTIAVLVMVYSDGYMAHDKGYVRFFTYLALFSSSMLGLIISPNLLEIYVFWELVGMCSYLLVGFWYDRDAAANAAQKAFVVNRVGDFGLLLGILGLFWATGSFGFEEIGTRLQEVVANGSVSTAVAVLLCLLVFMGPMAKSAQFPLHVWLPDAMEGPTPISALIHAATMVAAGVFLVARLQPVYAPFPAVQAVIAVIGTITLFLGASFFKAMLFLGSGSVIHAMEEVVGHEPVLAQDMRLMGGLRRYMPITAATFLIGCIAIAGIPPLAGFWSKDEILGQAFHHFPILWAGGFLTAGMTAFYMFRLYFLTFEGSFRGNDKGLQAQLLAAAGKASDHERGEQGEGHHANHPHESGWQMALPLVVLAVPSVLIGLLGMPWNSRFAALVDPHEAAEMAEHFSWQDFLPLAGSSVAISVAGISLAVLAYALHRIDLGQAVAARFPAINRFLANKWNLDAINDKLFVQGSRKIARQVLDVDSKVVDGVVNLTGLLTLGSGEGLKYFETGRAQFYALIVFGGVIAMVVLFGAFG
jgi:NAD(P)H-quinone oxidoreductase subunit 5